MLHLADITAREIGLFQRPLKPNVSEHIMLTPTGPVNRALTGAFIDAPPTTIPAAMLANMFRVLLGVRPCHTFRGCTEAHRQASESDVAVDLARRCRVNITSGIAYKEDGTSYLLRSPQMTAKAAPNSWAKASIPWAGPDPLTYRVSWHSVASEFGADIFDAFREVIVAVLGAAALQQDMVTVFSRLYKAKDKSCLRKFFADHDVSKAYSDTLLDGRTSGQYFGHTHPMADLVRHWKCDMVNRGVNNVSRRDCRISVLIDDSTKDMLLAGPGAATLLDSGYAELRIVANVPDTIVLAGEPAYVGA